MGMMTAREVPCALCSAMPSKVTIIGTRMIPPPIPRKPDAAPATAPVATYQSIFVFNFYFISLYLGNDSMALIPSQRGHSAPKYAIVK
jgi:hypothetical protein